MVDKRQGAGLAVLMNEKPPDSSQPAMFVLAAMVGKWTMCAHPRLSVDVPTIMRRMTWARVGTGQELKTVCEEGGCYARSGR